MTKPKKKKKKAAPHKKPPVKKVPCYYCDSMVAENGMIDHLKTVHPTYFHRHASKLRKEQNRKG
jgi:hypothetical protein